MLFFKGNMNLVMFIFPLLVVLMATTRADSAANGTSAGIDGSSEFENITMKTITEMKRATDHLDFFWNEVRPVLRRTIERMEERSLENGYAIRKLNHSTRFETLRADTVELQNYMALLESKEQWNTEMIETLTQFGNSLHAENDESNQRISLLETNDLRYSGVIGKLKAPKVVPGDCIDYLDRGYETDGAYPILLKNGRSATVSCDLTHGGWVVMQRRKSHYEMESTESLEYNRDIEDYKKGFGDFNGDHWLGLDTVHELTRTTGWTLRVDLESFDGETAWAEYSDFRITAAPDYRLLFDKSSYRGNTSENVADGIGLSYHHGLKFVNWENDGFFYHMYMDEFEKNDQQDYDDYDRYQNSDDFVAGNFGKGRYKQFSCPTHVAGDAGFWFPDTGRCASVLTTGATGGLFTIIWQSWKGYTPLKSVTLRIKKSNRDCKDLYDRGYTRDGVYTIQRNLQTPKVACDMSNGGWVVIQKRTGDSLNYDTGMDAYRYGFGDLNGDHWLGLYTVQFLTQNGNWTLRLEVTNNQNQTDWLEFDEFRITDSPDYMLLYNKASYRGTLRNTRTSNYGGDHLPHGMRFTTLSWDQDRWDYPERPTPAKDSWNCAIEHGGAWWFNGGSDASNLCAWVYTTGTAGRGGNSTGIYVVSDQHLTSATIKMRRNEPNV